MTLKSFIGTSCGAKPFCIVCVVDSGGPCPGMTPGLLWCRLCVSSQGNAVCRASEMMLGATRSATCVPAGRPLARGRNTRLSAVRFSAPQRGVSRLSPCTGSQHAAKRSCSARPAQEETALTSHCAATKVLEHVVQPHNVMLPDPGSMHAVAVVRHAHRRIGPR